MGPHCLFGVFPYYSRYSVFIKEIKVFKVGDKVKARKDLDRFISNYNEGSGSKREEIKSFFSNENNKKRIYSVEKSSDSYFKIKELDVWLPSIFFKKVIKER
jgi:hypothetical protein